jgi:hypothetical protein
VLYCKNLLTRQNIHFRGWFLGYDECDQPEAVKTVSAPLQNVVTVALNMRLLCTPLCSLLAVLNKLLVCLYYLARHISLLISLEIISLICYHLRPKETVLPDEMIVMAR